MSEDCGIVECRKCGKTFIHPHKCFQRDSLIDELRDSVIGVSLLIKKERERSEKLIRILSMVMEHCIDPSELDFEDSDQEQAYISAKAVLEKEKSC